MSHVLFGLLLAAVFYLNFEFKWYFTTASSNRTKAAVKLEAPPHRDRWRLIKSANQYPSSKFMVRALLLKNTTFIVSYTFSSGYLSSNAKILSVNLSTESIITSYGNLHFSGDLDSEIAFFLHLCINLSSFLLPHIETPWSNASIRCLPVFVLD